MIASDVETLSNRIPRSGSSAQPRMWLEPFLLLALEQWQSHGYELIRRMTTFGFEAIDGGGVYRTLRQLESDGLVSSGWVTSNEGPARRQYSVTDAGRAYLNVWAASLRGSQLMLDQFFSLYPPPPVPSVKASQRPRGAGANRPAGRFGRGEAAPGPASPVARRLPG